MGCCAWYAGFFCKDIVPEYRMREQEIQSGRTPLGCQELRKLPLEYIIQVSDAFGSCQILLSLCFNRMQKENNPCRPVPTPGDFAHPIDIFVSSLLKIFTYIEVGGRYSTIFPQHQSDQHTSDSAIPILKWMECFEFEMTDCSFDQELAVIIFNE